MEIRRQDIPEEIHTEAFAYRLEFDPREQTAAAERWATFQTWLQCQIRSTPPRIGSPLTISSAPLVSSAHDAANSDRANKRGAAWGNASMKIKTVTPRFPKCAVVFVADIPAHWRNWPRSRDHYCGLLYISSCAFGGFDLVLIPGVRTTAHCGDSIASSLCTRVASLKWIRNMRGFL